MTAPMAAFSDSPNLAVVATLLVEATTASAGVEPRRQTPHRWFLLGEAPTPSRA